MKCVFAWEPIVTLVERDYRSMSVVVYNDVELCRDIEGKYICCIGNNKTTEYGLPWLARIYKDMGSSTGNYHFKTKKEAVVFLEEELKRLGFRMIDRKCMVMR